MVETSDDWIVEAVWAGEFHNGDFDRTDLVFGTGIRIRDDVVDFVTSGTTFEQLWYTTQQDVTYVANSLPALLAVADIELLNDYPHYRRDLHSIRRGLYERIKAIPTSGTDVNSVYFNNLRLRMANFAKLRKPDSRTHPML